MRGFCPKYTVGEKAGKVLWNRLILQDLKKENSKMKLFRREDFIHKSPLISERAPFWKLRLADAKRSEFFFAARKDGRDFLRKPKNSPLPETETLVCLRAPKAGA